MAHAFLATADDLVLYGISRDFLATIDEELVNANLQAATDEALGRMSPNVVPPLTSWGSDIRSAVARIAVYEIKSTQGLSPVQAAVGDENLLVRATAAREWLDAVGAGDIDPQDLVDSSDSESEGGALVSFSSDAAREW